MSARITVYAELNANDVASAFEDLDFDDQLEVLKRIGQHFKTLDHIEEVVWHAAADDFVPIEGLYAIAKELKAKVDRDREQEI
jgi:hypothetical protein